jgi:hypothetical protein
MDESDERIPQQCAVRAGEECRLCVPGPSGPRDCGLAFLVMTDPELRDQLARLQLALARNTALGGERDEDRDPLKQARDP